MASYKIYKYEGGRVPSRPRRRSTGWIILHRITIGKGVKDIVDFFTEDYEGVATVTVSPTSKRLDAMREWRREGVPQWAKAASFVPYNYLVDKDGEIHKMLEDDARGAHCAGFNNTSIGVGIVGDFRKDLPTGAQVLSVKKLCRNLLWRYQKDLESDAIHSHDEMLTMKNKNTKNCPGTFFPVDEVREWAQLALEQMKSGTSRF